MMAKKLRAAGRTSPKRYQWHMLQAIVREFGPDVAHRIVVDAVLIDIVERGEQGMNTAAIYAKTKRIVAEKFRRELP